MRSRGPQIIHNRFEKEVAQTFQINQIDYEDFHSTTAEFTGMKTGVLGRQPKGTS